MTNAIERAQGLDTNNDNDFSGLPLDGPMGEESVGAETARSAIEVWDQDEIKDQVDLVVESMANLYDQSGHLTRRELRRLTRFTANSVSAVAERLSQQGMKLQVTVKNRDYKISDGRPHQQPVDLGTIQHDKGRRQLTVGGAYLFREICKAIYHDDDVKVIQPGKVEGGVLNELVYKTQFAEVDFEMSRFAHLSARERQERGIPEHQGRRLGRRMLRQVAGDSDSTAALAT